MHRLTVTAIAVGLVVSAPDAAQAQANEIECPIRIAAPEVEGETAVCGQIMVPQDWSDPNSTGIPITYLILKSTSIAPLPDPVIFFQGGPGGTTLNALSMISTGTDALRASRDVILFDQRGTGFSNDLYCGADVMIVDPEAHDDEDGSRAAAFDAFGLNAFSDPEAAFQVVADQLAPRDLSQCLPLFEERGIELEHYSTASTVQDTIAVMEHLGYASYNLFGASYGTTVVLSILDHYSQSVNGTALPGLRTAVLDSVHPTSIEFYAQAYEYSEVVLGVLSSCGEDPACASAYPDIRVRAGQLLATLQVAPLERDVGDPITWQAVADLMRTAVSLQTPLVPYIPRLVAELEQGETAVYDLAMAATRFEVTLPERTRKAEEAVVDQPDPFEETAAEIAGISSQLDAIEEAVQSIALANAFLREAALESDDRVDLIVSVFRNWSRSGGMLSGAVIANLEPYLLHPEQRTAEGLQALIQRTILLPGLQSEMLAIADRLDEDEVRQVFRALLSPSFDFGLIGMGPVTNYAVNCNDRGPRISNDLGFAHYLDFEVPQLIGPGVQWPAHYEIACAQLGLPAGDYAPPPPPV